MAIGRRTSGRKLVIPPPVQLPARRVIAAGTVVFVVAFVLLLPWTPPGRDHDSWRWIALAGAGLGVAGYLLTGRHRSQGRTR